MFYLLPVIMVMKHHAHFRFYEENEVYKFIVGSFLFDFLPTKLQYKEKSLLRRFVNDSTAKNDRILGHLHKPVSIMWGYRVNIVSLHPS